MTETFLHQMEIKENLWVSSFMRTKELEDVETVKSLYDKQDLESLSPSELEFAIENIVNVEGCPHGTEVAFVALHEDMREVDSTNRKLHKLIHGDTAFDFNNEYVFTV